MAVYTVGALWPCGHEVCYSFHEKPNLSVFQAFDIFIESYPFLKRYGRTKFVWASERYSSKAKVLGMLITYAEQHGYCDMWVASHYCSFFPKELPPPRWMNYSPLPVEEWFSQRLDNLIESYR